MTKTPEDIAREIAQDHMPMYDDIYDSAAIAESIADALRSYADFTIEEIAIRIGTRGTITADQLRGFKHVA